MLQPYNSSKKIPFLHERLQMGQKMDIFRLGMLLWRFSADSITVTPIYKWDKTPLLLQSILGYDTQQFPISTVFK